MYLKLGMLWSLKNTDVEYWSCKCHFLKKKVTVNAGVLEIHPWQIMMPHSGSWFFFPISSLLEITLTVQIKLLWSARIPMWMFSSEYFVLGLSNKMTDACFPLLTLAACTTPIWHTRRMARNLPFILLGN